MAKASPKFEEQIRRVASSTSYSRGVGHQQRPCGDFSFDLWSVILGASCCAWESFLSTKRHAPKNQQDVKQVDI